MTLAAITFKDDPNMAKLALLPLAVAAIGILASIAGTFFVKAKDEHGIHSALFRGLIIASIATIGGTAALINYFDFPAGVEGYKLLVAVIAGVGVGVLIGKVTEYYTSTETSPVHTIASKSETGSATNIIAGLAVGMRSVALTVILICIAIFAANWAGAIEGSAGYGVYCVALAAVGMLSTLGISLGIDAYGPVADNAGGLAEMAELPPEVRERTDALDAVGNTTAAIGKGFAIGSAALTALALFAAFRLRADELLGEGSSVDLSLTNTEVLIGLLIGGILPFLFAALTIDAVGRAAQSMIEEVRRQFREIPGLREGKEGVNPDSARCVAISTEASLKEMVVPGALAVVVPLVVGFIDVDALGGLLAGALVTGFALAIFMANAGGAWDNAKKYIEGGAHGGKGSEPYKAAVVGDTVGDPFKDTSGPALNILVKLMTVVGLVFLPWFI